MTVIGIDPGIDRVGVGIIEQSNNKYNLLFQQLIHTDKSLTTPQRLVGIYEQLQDILSNWKQIEAASVEKLFFCKNVTNAITVAQARGVICLALCQAGIPIFEYTPMQIKQALTGYGRGTKQQVQELVRMLLGLKELPTKNDDVADGMAMAITHINTARSMRKINPQF